MRLLYVVSYYKPAYVYGGPVRGTADLCEALAALGVELTVLTTNANAGQLLDVPLRRPVEVDGVQVVYYPVSNLPPRSFFHSPELAAACALNVDRFDLALLDTFYTHAMGPAAAACRRAGVPYVVPLRGQLLPWSLQHKAWKKRLYLGLAGRRYLNGAAALHCTDAIEAESAAALRLRPPAFVVPNGLHADRYARLPARGTLRLELDIPEDALVLLFLGRLHAVKQPQVAVQALAAAQAASRPVYLILAGPDEAGLADDLQAQAAGLGCEDRLRLTGLLSGERLLQALADADLFLMPSLSESFGNAAAEALAAGLPILVSDKVPVGRLAQAAGAGCAVPPEAAAFGRAALDLLADPARLKQMGERGRELARREFDLRAVAAQMLARCEEVLAAKGNYQSPVTSYPK